MTLEPSKQIRRQASLFLPNAQSIETLRDKFNPLQARLIPAHVTLCREDEVDDWSAFQRIVEQQLPIEIELGFGAPIRDGNLVLIPAISGIERFDEVRRRLLGGKPRKQDPHITIIHPRNGICSEEALEVIEATLRPFTAIFREVSLIEQTNGGPWTRFACLGKGEDSIEKN